MENQPNKKTIDRSDTKPEQNDGNGRDDHNTKHVAGNKDNSSEDALDNTDKYLAMEQPGVKYTTDTDPTVNSDQADFGSENEKKLWNEEGGNSRNSNAFNQDDYILNDNIDLDEDQNQSISSDDDDFEESNERYTN